MKSSRANVARRARGVFYGWWMVGAASFIMTLMALTVFQGLGIFLVALQAHFGWSRTAISGAFSLLRVEGAALGPVEGLLVDRLGAKRMVLIGFSILGIGFLFLSRIENLWQFFAVFGLIAVGSGVGGWLPMITVVNNWFIRRRSFAMATAMTGIHLGGFLVPVLALGIEGHGFRWTTLGIGLFLMATVLPVARVIRDRPEDYGMHPDGDTASPAKSPAVKAGSQPPVENDPEFTVAQALRTPAFWILTIVHMSSSVSIITLATHLVPKLTDIGMSLSGAGVVVLTYTAIAMPAQFVAGYLADRLPKPPVTFVFLMLMSTAMVVIAVAQNAYMAYLFALLFGIGFGGRVPLLTSIRGEYFGRRAFATLMGLSMLPNNLVMLGGPVFAGYMFDTTGTYVVPFTVLAVLSYMGAVLMLFARKPRTVPMQPESKQGERPDSG